MPHRITALLSFVSSFFFLIAQDTSKHLIDFRQRFLLPGNDHSEIEEIDSFRSLHIVIAGNIYQTEKHVASAYNKQTGRYDFKSELKYVQPILNLGDITIANLKTSFGNNANNMFSSPDEFALALKYAGITTLMHANVLTANIDKATLTRTRDLLYSFDMFHTGAFTDNMQRMGNYPLIINKKGFRIAVLNYTKLASRPAVSKDFVINEASKLMIEADMRMAKASKPDFTIAYFDWGANSQNIPSFVQMDIAKYVLEQGANLVVGADPNAPMRIDYVTVNTNGKNREGIVAYSIGNLIAGSDEMRNRNGYIIDMELKKNGFTDETKISDWGVVPVYTYFDTVSVPGTAKIFSVPCAAIESGDIFTNIPYIEKRRAVNSAYEVRKLLGSTADEIQYNLNEMIVNNVQESVELTRASLNNKFSLKRPEEIEPGAAPVLPVTSPGTDKAPSLTVLYNDSVITPKAPPKKFKQPSTPYEALKQMSELVFIEDVPAEKDTVRKNEEAIAVTQTTGAEIKSETENKVDIKPVAESKIEIRTDTIYRVQFYSLNKLIPLDTSYYTHLKGYEVFEEDGYFKYLIGKFKSFEECFKYWKTQIQPRYKQSFIVKYIHGRRYQQ